MEKKQRTYSKEIKLKAVKIYLEEGGGSNKIAKEFNQFLLLPLLF